jgi:hypothetical protein
VDAAGLAAGRAYQQAANASGRVAAAQKAALDYWTASNPQIAHALPGGKAISTTIDQNKLEVTVTTTQWVRTPFMSTAQLINPAPAKSGAPAGCTEFAWQCQQIGNTVTVRVATGGQTDEDAIEISVMLDVTGSMSGSKFTSMRLAAKDLIDIMLPEGISQSGSTRIALVPFAESVYPGEDITTQIHGAVTPGTCADNVPGCNDMKFSKYGGGTSTYRLSKKCVVARQGDDKYTDESPSISPVQKAYLGTQFSSSNTDGYCEMVNTGDVDVNKVMPLSADRDALITRINKMEIAGSTAGHIGTAWAWYMLSPKWGYLYPVANRAKPKDPERIKKVAILMTDGDYNTEYCKGVEAANSYTKRINCNGDGAESQPFAGSLCNAMKADGIVVYTVGFQVSTNARTFLRDVCATSTTHYYNASTGEALRSAFRDIALKVGRYVVYK